MKKNIIGTLLLIAVLLPGGCKDYQKHVLGAVDSGSADFSKYVAVGNSLTAGYESGALYQEAQKYSYPNLLARQIHINDFEQPLVSSPGIGGRLEVTDFATFSITADTKTGQPLNADLPRAYDNLGIPGAVLADYDNSDGNIGQRAANNPFYALIMRTELQKSNPTVNDLVKSLSPTLITFWLGNNDVLGYVISGGVDPITPLNQFLSMYQNDAQELNSTGATVAVLNIPDVTTIPYVFLTDALLQQEGKIKQDANGYYQLVTPQGNLNIYIQTSNGNRRMYKNDFLLLSSQTYLATANPANGDMVTPQGAIPTQYVLDGPAPNTTAGQSEVEQALTAVASYNSIIQSVATTGNFALVDIHKTFGTIFNSYLTTGTGMKDENGEALNPVPGSLFSLDGIHPTNKGYAVVTNTIIDALNGKFGSQIPEVEIRAIPLGIPWTTGNQ